MCTTRTDSSHVSGFCYYFVYLCHLFIRHFYQVDCCQEVSGGSQGLIAAKADVGGGIVFYFYLCQGVSYYDLWFLRTLCKHDAAVSMMIAALISKCMLMVCLRKVFRQGGGNKFL